MIFILDGNVMLDNQTKTDRISYSLLDNKTILQNRFKNSIDIVFYEFETMSKIKALAVYIEDLVDKDLLDGDVINPFIRQKQDETQQNITEFESIKKLMPVANMKEVNQLSETITNIIDGNVIIFIEKTNYAISIACQGFEKRAVTEPAAEMVVRGPKEGFIESINTNRALIRRKIRNENFVFEEFEIGNQTKTKINIAYIAGVVSAQVLDEVRRRLAKINTDSILDAGYLEEFIEDSHRSLVSTIGYSQKPDIVASKILEGRVAILCDGSPQVLTVPHVFSETLQTSEDYYNRPYISMILRLIRVVALFVSIFLPAFYVALETYHQEMIPSVFLVTMTGASLGVPFPASVEALLMVFAFEFLKESGQRMPKALGAAISIVGALVLGEAAVQAGIVSADLIVVIAFTAVASFIVSSLDEAVTLYRIISLFLGAAMGIFGITAGGFMMLMHLMSLRSFGVPYMSPLAPVNKKGLNDFIIRFPLSLMSRKRRFFR